MATIRFALLYWLFAAVLAPLGAADLPAQLAALLPEGAKFTSQSFGGSPTTAVAEFAAEKDLGSGRTVRYQFTIRAFDTNSPAWGARASAHRKQMEARIARSREGLAPESANQGLFTADAVKEKATGWGSSLSQRVLHHEPQAPAYVDYYCAYFGMAGGIVFELLVSGIPDSAGAADQWAQSVADAAGRLTVSNIGDR